MKIQIKPVVRELTILNIVGVNVSLDNSAIVSVSLMSEDNISQSFTLYMDAQTYANWGSTDSYVVDWVMAQLGLQPA
jgi:hypothetical protein